MNILLTGGAGYIGSVTAEKLVQKGHTVVVYDNLSTGHEEAVPRGALFIRADLSQKEKIKEILKKYGIDAVVHFAGSSIVSESVKNPSRYYVNNVSNGLSLLDAMAESGTKRIIFSSTAAVYGEPKQIPIQEDAVPCPTNPYGETKLAFEKALDWYSRAYGISYVSLRYFNAAGASSRCGEDHETETHLIPLVLQAAAGKRKKITIYGTDYPTYDGTCIRDYIHVLDLAEAHLLALEAKDHKNGIYNLGNGEGYSVLEVIQTAEKITGKTISVEYGLRRAGDPPVLVASSEKIHQEFGWKPRYPLIETIIKDAWTWHQKFPEGYKSVLAGEIR